MQAFAKPTTRHAVPCTTRLGQRMRVRPLVLAHSSIVQQQEPTAAEPADGICTDVGLMAIASPSSHVDALGPAAQQPEAKPALKFSSENSYRGEAVNADPSSSGDTTSWPAGNYGDGQHSQRLQQRQELQQRRFGGIPPYAPAMAFMFKWPNLRPLHQRPEFLGFYPAPDSRRYNVNSFLGRKDLHQGRFYVPVEEYSTFLHAYCEALASGYGLFLTENYHHQMYRYFVELDWDWDTPLEVVMEVTPQLMDLIQQAVGAFYSHVGLPYYICSIRTPYKVHLNFPHLITTELMANMCRDRILELCRSQLGHYSVDWERLIDFPHGSLRLMGSRKPRHIDRDPEWVRDKAYHPGRLEGGRWKPGRILPDLLLRASIFPTAAQVAKFEKSALYLDMVFTDHTAYLKKMAERAWAREAKLQAAGLSGVGSRGNSDVQGGASNAPSRPVQLRIVPQEDGTVTVNIMMRRLGRRRGRDMEPSSQEQEPTGADTANPTQQPIMPPL